MSNFLILCDIVAQENGWKDFDDVIYNCKQRVTIRVILDEANELFLKKPNP